MNWDAISTIAEIVGTTAVVASLIYLGIQTRANARALRASSIWDSETAFGHINFDHANHPELCDLLSKMFVPDAKIEEFSDTEINQAHFAFRGVMQFMQAQWALWKEGILPDDLWERRRNWTCGLISLPLIKTFWEAEVRQQLVSTEFREEIESALKSNFQVSIKVGRKSVER
ncbi:MAG: hypothetical protein ACI92G_002210 [Candidatus Pelagisphaera sp.]|jgi:hypothetical protein